ncbi:DEAD/DEAH box helicase [Variovorax sp. PCZ-1]|uniref:DEAD/DEAH box helicase n=1 Tax=Variovorax sp. PCZ-1 TaxID=2835533 RepID=UPI001BD0CF70|nr:DEAD/DEAH box helicase [Variovorax sp. PCZ-1]MBS7807935.1 DEAD/DEAH box helicase [Variovorax sp. PCZ-1]
MPFSNLGFAPPVLAAFNRALQAEDFTQATEVQRAVIPAILQGRDVIASAQTGSGKTAAYALPILQQISDAEPAQAGKPRCLVIVPTRELAVQVEEMARKFAKFLPRKTKLLATYGGVAIEPQMLAMREGVDILIATPGRLLDLADQRALSFKSIKYFVLDEADRLLDLGFNDELKRILTLMPEKRQNLFFSATFSAEIEILAAALLRDPLRIQIVSEEQEKPKIEERAVAVDAAQRTQLFKKLFTENDWERALIFVARQYDAEKVAMKLRNAGLKAEPLHGQLTQGKRMQVVQDIKAGRIEIVVATDLASRGLDIKELPVVVNYDLPRSATDYTHRIGRTGRAGMPGLAVSFVTVDMQAHWELICKRQNLQTELEEIEGFEPTDQPPLPDAPLVPTGLDINGGIKGKRPSKKDKLRAAAALAAAKDLG